MAKNRPLKKVQLTPDLLIAYEDTGRGLPVLFLHGMGSTHRIWQRNIEHISRQFQCIAPDLPGYGQSGSGGSRSTLGNYVKDLITFIEKLGIDKLIMVGHSMGAQLALQLVNEQANFFSKLILIAPAGFEYFTSTEKIWLKNIYSPDVLTRLPIQKYIENLQSNFTGNDGMDHSLIEEFKNLYYSSEFRQYCQTISANISSMLDEPLPLPFTHLMPSLIIFGAQDQMIPNRILHASRTTREIAHFATTMLTNSNLSILENAGHFVHWEKATIVNQLILDFLE
ncbi:MAG: alpha/beta hydrolase [Saprospiraceae bacterium]|nr:alpha/beta hydrolase [Saprospiraceae bacterium]